jgi:hypothetical protein
MTKEAAGGTIEKKREPTSGEIGRVHGAVEILTQGAANDKDGTRGDVWVGGTTDSDLAVIRRAAGYDDDAKVQPEAMVTARRLADPQTGRPANNGLVSEVIVQFFGTDGSSRAAVYDIGRHQLDGSGTVGKHRRPGADVGNEFSIKRTTDQTLSTLEQADSLVAAEAGRVAVVSAKVSSSGSGEGLDDYAELATRHGVQHSETLSPALEALDAELSLPAHAGGSDFGHEASRHDVNADEVFVLGSILADQARTLGLEQSAA